MRAYILRVPRVVHRQAEAPNPDLFFVSFADCEDLVRNLNAAWRSNDDRLGCWRFSPRSPRAFLLRAVTGPAIPPLRASRRDLWRRQWPPERSCVVSAFGQVCFG